MLINYINKLRIVLKVVLKARKVFSLPSQNNLIILEQTGKQKIVDHVLGHNDFQVMSSKYKIINIPILILSIFSIHRYKKFFYEVTYIKYVNAKFALTWIDNSYQYCQIIKHIPSCKLGLIQNGRSDDSRFKFFKFKKLECDYYFINGEFVKSYFEKNISTKFIVSGSPIANNFNLGKFEKITKIKWISHFRNFSKIKKESPELDIQNYYVKPVENSLKEVYAFCIKHDLSFEVLGRTKSQDEYLFHKHIIGEDVKVIPNDLSRSSYKSYELLSNDSIIAGLDSQLLYEAFGIGYRTAFFTTRSFYFNDKSLRFAWPKKTEDTGPFWTNIPEKKNIKSILNYLMNVQETEWKKQLVKFEGVMFHNPSNKIIRNVLAKENVKLSQLKF